MNENKNMNLAEIATQTAMQAAVEYLRVHNLKANDAALVSCLKAWCKIKLPEALRDAKEAFDCGMHQVGQATFLATMKLAGIEAAKEAGFHESMIS